MNEPKLSDIAAEAVVWSLFAMTTPNHHTINALHELTHNITNDEFLADILYTEALTHQLFNTTTPQPLPDTLSGDNLQLAINMCRNDFTDHAGAALTEWRNDNRINNTQRP